MKLVLEHFKLDRIYWDMFSDYKLLFHKKTQLSICSKFNCPMHGSCPIELSEWRLCTHWRTEYV